MSRIEGEVAKLVASGKGVQEGVSKLVAKAIGECHRSGEDFSQIIHAVKNGVTQGVSAEMARDANSHVHEVMSGVVDGVTTALNSVKLTMEESAAAGERLTSAEFNRFQENLKKVGGSLRVSFEELAASIHGATEEESARLREHAASVQRQLGPVFVGVLDSLSKQPLEIASETMRAGAGGLQAGAGVLLGELGTRVSELSSKLNPKRPQK